MKKKTKKKETPHGCLHAYEGRSIECKQLFLSIKRCRCLYIHWRGCLTGKYLSVPTIKDFFGKIPCYRVINNDRCWYSLAKSCWNNVILQSQDFLPALLRRHTWFWHMLLMLITPLRARTLLILVWNASVNEKSFLLRELYKVLVQARKHYALIENKMWNGSCETDDVFDNAILITGEG